MDDQQAGSDDNSGQNSTSQQMEEQKWLQNLRQLAQQCKTEFTNTTPRIPTAVQEAPQPHSYETGYYIQQQQQQHIDQQFMEINKQFSELNLQYQAQQTNENLEHQQPTLYNPEQQQLHAYQQQQEPLQSFASELPKQQNSTDLQQPGETTGVMEALPDNYQQQPQYLQPELTQSSPDFGANYYDSSQYKANNAAGNNLDNQQQSNYDYWTQQQQQQLNFNQTAEEVSVSILQISTKKLFLSFIYNS